MQVSDGIFWWCYSRQILTETETQLISQKRFHELVEQQKKVDAEIDAQLSRQEDDLRLEEEVNNFACNKVTSVRYCHFWQPYTTHLEI